jgi:hypothetical protein
LWIIPTNPHQRQDAANIFPGGWGMPTFRVDLTGSKSFIDFQHYEVSWFAKELIYWRNRHEGLSESEFGASTLDEPPDQSRIYKATIFGTVKILKKADPNCPQISDKRLKNMIARGFTELRREELEFFKRAIGTVWISGIPEAVVRGMAMRAKGTAIARLSRERGKGELDPRLYAGMLDLTTKRGSQIKMRDFLGSYLIFRRIAGKPKLVVSYMELQQDLDAKLPATFVTTSHVTGEPYEEADVVKGVAYFPREDQELMFTFGKLLKTAQVRSSILQPVRKPDMRGAAHKFDLRGIRLGLSRPGRSPIGYRIWCSRIESTQPPEGWQIFARQYDLTSETSTDFAPMAEFEGHHRMNPGKFFSQHIVGLPKIIHWLNDQHVAKLD